MRDKSLWQSTKIFRVMENINRKFQRKLSGLDCKSEVTEFTNYQSYVLKFHSSQEYSSQSYIVDFIVIFNSLKCTVLIENLIDRLVVSLPPCSFKQCGPIRIMQGVFNISQKKHH